jgi:hypothetical protein
MEINLIGRVYNDQEIDIEEAKWLSKHIMICHRDENARKEFESYNRKLSTARDYKENLKEFKDLCLKYNIKVI